MERVKLSPQEMQGGQFLDEPAAPAGRVKLSPQELQGGQFLDQQQSNPPQSPGGLEHGAGQTFVRSAMDMLTLGHHDEISGWIDSALEGHPFDEEVYRRNRDKYRTEMKAGNEEHPVAHYAGMAAGVGASALIPGLNVAKGASVGGAALKAGAIGAAAGLGNSEADLTKSEFGQAALDAAIGAGTGAVVGAAGQKLSNWIKAAPARQEARELASVKEGIQYKTKIQKIEPIEKEMMAKLRDAPEIRKGIESMERSPVALAETPKLVAQKVKQVGDSLEPFYEQMAASGRDGVPFDLVENQLKGVRSQFRGVAKAPLAENVDGLIEKFRTAAMANDGKIPAQLLREDATTFQTLGFGNLNMFGPVPIVKQLKQQVGGALREAIADHVESLADDTKTGKTVRGAFRSANKDMSHWLRIQDVVDEKAARIRQNAPPMGSLVGGVTNLMRRPIRTAASLAAPIPAAATRALASGPGQAVTPIAAAAPRGLAGLAERSGARAGAFQLANDDDEPSDAERKQAIAMRLQQLRDGR